MKLRAIAPGVGLLPLYANIYLLSTPQGRVLFDTGTINHAPTFVRLLRAFDPQAVVISHSHIDHAGSAFLAARLGYPVVAHPLEHARLLGQDHTLPYPAGRPRTGRLISRLHPRPGAGQLQAVEPGESVEEAVAREIHQLLARDGQQHVVLRLREVGLGEVGADLAEHLVLRAEQALPRGDGEAAVGHGCHCSPAVVPIRTGATGDARPGAHLG